MSQLKRASNLDWDSFAPANEGRRKRQKVKPSLGDIRVLTSDSSSDDSSSEKSSRSPLDDQRVHRPTEVYSNLDKSNRCMPCDEDELPIVPVGYVSDEIIKDGRVIFKWPVGLGIGQSRLSKRNVHTVKEENWKVERWFPCFEPGCGKMFKTSEELYVHSRRSSTHKYFEPKKKKSTSTKKQRKQQQQQQQQRNEMEEWEETEQNAERSNYEWHIATDNQTPKQIASIYKLSTRDLVKTNKKYFEGFSVMCRLRKGTHVQISHLEVVSMRTKRRSGEALPRH